MLLPEIQGHSQVGRANCGGTKTPAFVEISLALVVPKIGETWPPSIIIISIFDEIIGGEFHRQVFHGQDTSVVQTTLIDLFRTEKKNCEHLREELDLNSN